MRLVTRMMQTLEGPFVQRRLTFELTPIAPFCLEFTAWGLRRRPENQVDRWDGDHLSTCDLHPWTTCGSPCQ